MRRAFADEMQKPDLVVTNRTLPEAIEHLHEPHPEGAILCPEGGGLHVKGLWTTVSGRTRLAGERFHESAVRRMAEIEAPLPLDARPFCVEIELRRHWRAIAFARNVADRQAAEENPAPTEAVLEAIAAEKQASVRQFGRYSLNFTELYGNMPAPEWDELWQRWQAEALQRAPEAA